MSSPKNAKILDNNIKPEEILKKQEPKNKGKKRKRESGDSETELEMKLPENALELEKNLQASAAKNNLDDVSVKKILRKVVKNDHVLALVKLKEEEENATVVKAHIKPKLTRAKVKELMKVSPKSAPWDLEKLELTPIKHIHVKTRPEVKALIAQELQEDEDDEEYEPTHEEPSDDDQTVESCSDLDSQPMTPATPKSYTASPDILQDGPFKVPRMVSTPVRRKLDMQEEATIALRTRSKLSLSATPIEHIESSFVPPDDLPYPIVDDLWNQFLTECLDPAPNSKHEDDDETDPEYNVAADPDAHDEDEVDLENSILKISKKELNDLVNELFNVMPNSSPANSNAKLMPSFDKTDVVMASTSWEGKQEPKSDEEVIQRDTSHLEHVNCITDRRFSIGKSEPTEEIVITEESPVPGQTYIPIAPAPIRRKVHMSLEEHDVSVSPAQECVQAPKLLRHCQVEASRTTHIQITPNHAILPAQIQILQQQLRQHFQISTSNFLQLYVHPIHWRLAPKFKEYLEAFVKITELNKTSVANVCNLRPAWDLVHGWEKSVSETTPENTKMIEFIQNEIKKNRRSLCQNRLYIGDFPELFKQVIANSPVFQYPFLLPSVPFRPDTLKRYSYTKSEDELMALGLDEFWQYVEANPEIYKRNHRGGGRWGLRETVDLVSKYLFPWLEPRVILNHIHLVRKRKDIDNPINLFFKNREVSKVQHVLWPFNPKITLYEQPEHEMPKIWIRHLAKTSKRFKKYYFSPKSNAIKGGNKGIVVNIEKDIQVPKKNPLPIHFTSQKTSTRLNVLPQITVPSYDKVDVEVVTKELNENPKENGQAQTKNSTNQLYTLINSSTGQYIVPVTAITNTVNHNNRPICSWKIRKEESQTVKNGKDKEQNKNLLKKTETNVHCECCVLLRKICKTRQTLIPEYFKKTGMATVIVCPCKQIQHPRVTKRLKLLVKMFKNNDEYVWGNLIDKSIEEASRLSDKTNDSSEDSYSHEEREFVTNFKIKLLTRMVVARNNLIKKRFYDLIRKFKTSSDNPTSLAFETEKIFDVELVDMYKEFLCFLTPAQADVLGKFKYYFIQNCMTDLVKKIEVQVLEKQHRLSMLSQIKSSLLSSQITACEFCSLILKTMEGYPDLAREVFFMFPHRQRSQEHSEAQVLPAPSSPPEQEPHEETNTQTIDYEADHSSSGEENREDSCGEEEYEIIVREVKHEESFTQNILDTTELGICKTEIQYNSDTSHTSDAPRMVILEDFKTEELEWTREEDKLILEILKDVLTPEERRDRSLQELIEQKKVYEIITNSLPDKTIDEVEERVLYLIEVLSKS